MMRKFVVYVLSPLIAVVLVLLRVPTVESTIKCWHPYAPDGITAFIVLGTLYAYYISIWSPYADWLKMKKQLWEKLNEAAEQLKTHYQADYDLSMNIMVPKRKFLFYLEPRKDKQGNIDKSKKKLSWTGKVFKVIWSYGNDHVRRNLKFTTNQGACGNAYVEEKITGVAFSHGLIYDFNFTNEQESATKGLQMVVSCPIVIKTDHPFEQEIDIFGVLNVESRTPGSETLVADPLKQKDFYEKINILVKTYSKMK